MMFGQAQKAAGVKKTLKTARGCATRWNGFYKTVKRNNLLQLSLEVSLRNSQTLTVFAVDDDGIVQDGENGTDVKVRDIELSKFYHDAT